MKIPYVRWQNPINSPGSHRFPASACPPKDLSSLRTQKNWDGSSCPRTVHVDDDGSITKGAAPVGNWKIHIFEG